MKKVCIFLLVTSLTVSLAGCGGAVENKPANTANANANVSKPAPAAPTADTLLAMDRRANEAYIKGDSSYFDSFLSDKFAMLDMKGKRMDKAGAIKDISSVKCDVKTWDLTEPQTAKIDNDTYVLSYKATWDGTCTQNGKSMKIPSPVRAASVFIRNGENWQGAWHGEATMIEPKGDAKKDEAKKEEGKKDGAKPAEVAKADEVTAEAAKKEAPKKEEAKKEEPKKETAKKEEPKKEDKTAANAAPAEAAKPDANTDALTKIHQSGWEAWRDKDAAKLTSLTASSLAFVDAEGKWFGTKDEVIREWTGAECKDVKNVKVSDGFASALSPTVEVFTHSGTADGTCGGHKNGKLWGTAFYVKEGADWKLAFLFETPAM